MSTAELQEIVARLAKSQEETDRQMKEFSMQNEGLGNKFSTFAECLAFASIRRLLREKYGMEAISRRFEIQKGAESEEYDVLAYSNGGKNQGVIVEVKSLLDFRAITQMERKMDRLFDWLPEHLDKAFQGIVAYVHGGKDEREAAIEKGWHLIHVGEDLFHLETKEGFQPRIYRSK